VWTVSDVDTFGDEEGAGNAVWNEKGERKTAWRLELDYKCG
jgi:hypothetical protein